jgi:hypothetical protein
VIVLQLRRVFGEIRMQEMRSTPEVPGVVIYCDESCHDLTGHHPFMSIGGLKITRSEKPTVSGELRHLMKSIGLNSELKWSKVSSKKLAEYKQILDFFFKREELCFRAIVVPQKKVNLDRYHGRDRELAFYKFYYEMLEKWLEVGKEHLILLDYKTNKGAKRYTTLRTYLERWLRGKAWIRDLTIIDSKQTPLAQLCDILTGAVAAAHNGTRSGGAKEALAQHIADKAGLPSLRTSTALTASKFNIFKMDLG